VRAQPLEVVNQAHSNVTRTPDAPLDRSQELRQQVYAIAPLSPSADQRSEWDYGGTQQKWLALV